MISVICYQHQNLNVLPERVSNHEGKEEGVGDGAMYIGPALGVALRALSQEI